MRWFVIQHELMPELRSEVGALTPKLEQVVHTLEVGEDRRVLSELLPPGGMILLDDYVFTSCPGVKRAADYFLAKVFRRKF